MTNPSYQAGYNGLGTPPGGSSTQWQLGDVQRQQDQFYAGLARRHQEEQAAMWSQASQTSPQSSGHYGIAMAGGVEEGLMIVLFTLGTAVASFALLFVFMGAGAWGLLVLLASLAAVVFSGVRLVELNKGQASVEEQAASATPVAEATTPSPTPPPCRDDQCPVPIHLMKRRYFTILEWGQPLPARPSRRG